MLLDSCSLNTGNHTFPVPDFPPDNTKTTTKKEKKGGVPSSLLTPSTITYPATSKGISGRKQYPHYRYEHKPKSGKKKEWKQVGNFPNRIFINVCCGRFVVGVVGARTWLVAAIAIVVDTVYDVEAIPFRHRWLSFLVLCRCARCSSGTRLIGPPLFRDGSVSGPPGGTCALTKMRPGRSGLLSPDEIPRKNLLC